MVRGFERGRRTGGNGSDLLYSVVLLIEQGLCRSEVAFKGKRFVSDCLNCEQVKNTIKILEWFQVFGLTVSSTDFDW